MDNQKKNSMPEIPEEAAEKQLEQPEEVVQAEDEITPEEQTAEQAEDASSELPANPAEVKLKERPVRYYKDNQTDGKKAKKKKKLSKAQKGVIITLAVLTGLSTAAVVVAKTAYDNVFKRYNRPDYAITAGVCCYDRVDQSVLKREERTFYSDGVKLQGYYYPCENSKGLTVICHGLHAGADDYLPIAEYMVRSGYSVFSFDYKGTYSSGGKSTVGMCEALVDLDHALNYLEKSDEFKDMPIYLIGHSWGGYAVTSVLSLHKKIKGVAAIAAPNNGYTLFLEKGEQYAGSFGSKGAPEMFLNTYQKILFKDYVNYNAVKGINSTDIPVFIAHGADDDIIKMDSQSIVAHREEIRKQNVYYYVTSGEQGGHNSLWHSKEAIAYQSEIKEQEKALKKAGNYTYEQKVAFNSTVNHSLYSEVNGDMFNQIVKMFDGTVKK